MLDLRKRCIWPLDSDLPALTTKVYFGATRQYGYAIIGFFALDRLLAWPERSSAAFLELPVMSVSPLQLFSKSTYSRGIDADQG